MKQIGFAERTLSFKQQAIIFAAALLARLGFLLTLIEGKRYSGSDTFLYLEIAENILRGNGFSANAQPTAFVSPGFPLFLAASIKIFGDNLIWASVVQCIFSALACVLIGQTAALIFGRKVGSICGLTAAFYFELIMWASPQLLTEPFYIFFLSAAIYFLIKAMPADRKILTFLFASGICFGLAGLFRPTAFLLAVSTSVFLLAVYFRQNKKHLFRPFLLLAACFLVMLPWGIRNYLTLDHFTILSQEGGHVFWLGNNPEYDKFDHPDMTRFGGYTTMFQPFPDEVSQAPTEAEQNRLFYRIAWRHIFNHPLNFIVRGFHKMWNMWRPAFSNSSTRNLLISLTIYPLALFSAIAGMFLSLKAKKSGEKLSIRILIWIFLTNLAIHFLVTGEIRFRVPLWIFLLPFAAYLWVEGFTILKRKFFERKPIAV